MNLTKSYFLILMVLGLFVGCFGGGGGGGKSQSSSDNKEDTTTTKVSCETTVTVGNKELGDFKVDEGEILDYSTICPAGTSAASATITCGSDGNFDAAAKCISDYIESGVNCDGTSVDFDETSMVLKYRVLGDYSTDDITTTEFDETDRFGAKDYAQTILFPAIKWRYLSESENNLGDINPITSDGSVSDYADLFDETNNQTDFYINWGDGTCAHVTYDNFDYNDLIHTYSSTADMEEDVDGYKVATVKIVGNVGMINNGWFQGYVRGETSTNPSIGDNHFFRHTLAEVVEVGDLGWINMHGAFEGTSALQYGLNFADLSRVVDTGNMFSAVCSTNSKAYKFLSCPKLNLDLSGLELPRLKYADEMFEYSIFNSVDFSNINLESLIDFSYSFVDTTVVESIDLSYLSLPKVETLRDLFYSLNYLVEIDKTDSTTLTYPEVSLWFDKNGDGLAGISEVTTKIDTTGWDFTGEARELELDNLFNEATVAELSIPEWKGLNLLSEVTVSSFVYYLDAVTLDISNLELSKSTSMENFFRYTDVDELIGIEDLDTSNITNMSAIFSGADIGSKIDLSKWDTSNVTNMKYALDSSSNTVFNLGYWDMTSVNASQFIENLTDGATMTNIYCHAEGDEATAGTIVDNLNSDASIADSDPSDDKTFHCAGAVAP